MFTKKLIMVVVVSWLLATMAGTLIAGTQGPTRGPVEPTRDQVMELNAKHNLDVAKWYLTKRKAYEGARNRLQEIFDTYPEFSRMDEVLFYLGEANLKLNKKDKAIDFYTKLLKQFPNSEHSKKSRERLDELQGTKNE